MNLPAFGPENEALWDTLNTHLDWSSGPWIGFVWSDHWPILEAFRVRTEERLTREGRALDTLRIEEDEQVEPTLITLLEHVQSPSLCTWVSIELDDETGPNPARRFLARLNERRERLRRHRPGGVMLVLPERWREDLLAVCPDLWTVRSVVLEPVPPPPSDGPLRLPTMPMELPIAPSQDPVGDRAMLARAEAKGDVAGQAQVLLRLAVRELEAQRFGEASALAREAKQVLRVPGAPRHLDAMASSMAGAAAFGCGDLGQAQAQLREAFALRQDPPDSMDLLAALTLLRVSLQSRVWEREVEAWARTQAISGRRRHRDEEESHANLLTELAAIAQARGQRAETTKLAKEAARLFRGLVLIAPTRDELKVGLAHTNVLLADVAVAEGSLAEGIKMMRRERRVLMEVLSRKPEDTGALHQLAHVTHVLVSALLARGREQEATEQALESLRLVLNVLGSTVEAGRTLPLSDVCVSGAQVCATLVSHGLTGPLRDEIVRVGLELVALGRSVPGPASSRLAELERQLRALPSDAPPP